MSVFLELTKRRAEGFFKRLLLILKGRQLFLLSVILALSPIQDRGTGASRREHRPQPGKRLTGKVILCDVLWFSSSVKSYMPLLLLNIL